MEKTFSIIKPNAMKKNVVGEIIHEFEKAGLRICAARIMHIDKPLCEEFYAEHKDRPFFGELVDFMTSHPVMVMVLGGENAVSKNRDIMGATDPSKAESGTLRARFGDSVGENAVHGSDSPASAEREIRLFFEANQIF